MSRTCEAVFNLHFQFTRSGGPSAINAQTHGPPATAAALSPSGLAAQSPSSDEAHGRHRPSASARRRSPPGRPRLRQGPRGCPAPCRRGTGSGTAGGRPPRRRRAPTAGSHRSRRSAVRPAQPARWFVLRTGSCTKSVPITCVEGSHQFAIAHGEDPVRTIIAGTLGRMQPRCQR